MDETSENLITVDVDTRYLEDQSDPDERRYVFAYTITIRNRGAVRCPRRAAAQGMIAPAATT